MSTELVSLKTLFAVSLKTLRVHACTIHAVSLKTLCRLHYACLKIAPQIYDIYTTCTSFSTKSLLSFRTIHAAACTMHAGKVSSKTLKKKRADTIRPDVGTSARSYMGRTDTGRMYASMRTTAKGAV